MAKKIQSLADAKKAAGITDSGGGDHGDLETVKVSSLCEAGNPFVVYEAEEMDSQYEEGTVFVCVIGDDKEPKAKFWSSHVAIKHQLRKALDHDLIPFSTKIVKKKGKSGREYFDLDG